MFQVEDEVGDWRLRDMQEKKETLREWGIRSSDADEVLLRDRVFPTPPPATPGSWPAACPIADRPG